MPAVDEPSPAAFQELMEGTGRVVGLMSRAVEGEPVGLITMACATMLIIAAKRSEFKDDLLRELIEALIEARKLRDGQ